MDQAIVTRRAPGWPGASTPITAVEAVDEGSVHPHNSDTILVLGGGGGRGSAQVGVLRALAAHGIRVDAVVGTSVGAVNGAAVAALSLPAAVGVLHELWRDPLVDRLFRFSRLEVLRAIATRRPWVTDGLALRRFLTRATTRLQVEHFSELRLPLFVVMTDLEMGRIEVRSEGRLIDALCASTAIPGVYPPVSIGERSYVDGGIVDTVPIDIAAVLSPQRIIAIDLTAKRPVTALKRWTDIIDRSWALAQHAQMLAAVEQLRGRVPVTVISPLFPQYRNPLGLPDVDVLEEGAYRATRDLLSGEARGRVSPGVFSLDLALAGAPVRRARHIAFPQPARPLAAVVAAAPGLITAALGRAADFRQAPSMAAAEPAARLGEG